MKKLKSGHIYVLFVALLFSIHRGVDWGSSAFDHFSNAKQTETMPLYSREQKLDHSTK